MAEILCQHENPQKGHSSRIDPRAPLTAAREVLRRSLVMLCIRHRSLFVLVMSVLLSVLLLGPGAAHARPLGMDRPPAAAVPADLPGLLGILEKWLHGLFEKAGWGMDPNGGIPDGTAPIGLNAGWGMDPNGGM
jgi:hypothetical protein